MSNKSRKDFLDKSRKLIKTRNTEFRDRLGIPERCVVATVIWWVSLAACVLYDPKFLIFYFPLALLVSVIWELTTGRLYHADFFVIYTSWTREQKPTRYWCWIILQSSLIIFWLVWLESQDLLRWPLD